MYKKEKEEVFGKTRGVIMIKTIFEGLGLKITIMAILLGIACFLTYYFYVVVETGAVFTHYFYVPIVLACLWWKKKGLFVAIFLVAVFILSDIFLRAEVMKKEGAQPIKVQHAS